MNRVRPGWNPRFSENSKIFNGDKISLTVCFRPQGHILDNDNYGRFLEKIMKKSDFDDFREKKATVCQPNVAQSKFLVKSDGFPLTHKIYKYFTQSDPIPKVMTKKLILSKIWNFWKIEY